MVLTAPCTLTARTTTWERLLLSGVSRVRAQAYVFGCLTFLILGDAFDFDLAEATLPRQASQMWAIPDLPDNLGDDELFCSIRLRYNMTSNDYPSVNGFNVDDGPLFDNDANCPGVELNLNAADVNDVGTGASAGCEALQVEGRPLYNR